MSRYGHYHQLNQVASLPSYEEIIFPLGIVGRLIGLVGQGSSYKFVTEMQAKLKSLVEA